MLTLLVVPALLDVTTPKQGRVNCDAAQQEGWSTIMKSWYSEHESLMAAKIVLKSSLDGVRTARAYNAFSSPRRAGSSTPPK
jgi:hypothetical protein